MLKEILSVCRSLFCGASGVVKLLGAQDICGPSLAGSGVSGAAPSSASPVPRLFCWEVTSGDPSEGLEGPYSPHSLLSLLSWGNARENPPGAGRKTRQPVGVSSLLSCRRSGVMGLRDGITRHPISRLGN